MSSRAGSHAGSRGNSHARTFVRRGIRALTVVSIALLCAVAPVVSAQAEGSCAGQVVNGGFESPVMTSLVEGDIFFDSSNNYQPGGWFVWDGNGTSWTVVASLPATDTATSQSLAWKATEGGVELQRAVTPYSGDQYAEITGLDVTNTLYQTVTTQPGQVMMWSLAHRSAGGTDVMEVQIGADLASMVGQPATPGTGDGVPGEPTHISDDGTWRVWSGSYTVPAGQTETVFGFKGISSGSGTAVGNYIDDITFTCDPTGGQSEGGPGDSSGGGSGGDSSNGEAQLPSDPSLVNTGLTTAALAAGVALAGMMFVSASLSLSTRVRLREVAVNIRLAGLLRQVDTVLRRLENPTDKKGRR